MNSWERVFHAYGPARGGDELLDVLRHGEEERYVREHPDLVWWRQPYSFLWSALYCAGRITPATALGLRYLASAITEDDFGGPDPTLHWAALWWMREVARTVTVDVDVDQARHTATRRDDPSVLAWLDEYLRHERKVQDWDEEDEPGRVLLAAAEVDCFEALPEVFGPVTSLLAPQRHEQLRETAASAASMLVRHPGLQHHRAAIMEYHLVEAALGTPQYRASMLLGLGDLGGPTEPWLDDPHLGVRVCAALAPALATDATATQVLTSAAALPSHVLDHVFGAVRLPQLLRLSSAVTEALRDRVENSDASAAPRLPQSPPQTRKSG